MKCFKCGFNLNRDMIRCSNCGVVLKTAYEASEDFMKRLKQRRKFIRSPSRQYLSAKELLKRQREPSKTKARIRQHEANRKSFPPKHTDQKRLD